MTSASAFASLAVRVHPAIAVRKLDALDEQHSVFASSAIGADTPLVAVPFSSLLMCMSSLECPAALVERGKTLGKLLGQLKREDDILALRLLFEKYELGEAHSRWASYIEGLPAAYSDTLASWPEKDLELLDGSHAKGAAEQLRKQIEADFAELTDFGDDVAADFAWLTLENYRWALQTIWSRAINVNLATAGEGGIGGKQTVRTHKALAPFFSFFNHAAMVGPERNVWHEMAADDEPAATSGQGVENPTGAALIMKTHRAVAEGEELKISYGPLPNHKLLLLYGFVLPKDKNPHDAVPFTLPKLPRDAPDFAAKLRVLIENGRRPMQPEVFELSLEDPLPHALVSSLRVRLATRPTDIKNLAKAFGDGDGGGGGGGGGGTLLSKRNEVAVLSSLADAIRSTLREEPGAAAAAEKSHHAALAAALHAGERRILSETREAIATRQVALINVRDDEAKKDQEQKEQKEDGTGATVLRGAVAVSELDDIDD